MSGSKVSLVLCDFIFVLISSVLHWHCYASCLDSVVGMPQAALWKTLSWHVWGFWTEMKGHKVYHLQLLDARLLEVRILARRSWSVGVQLHVSQRWTQLSLNRLVRQDYVQAGILDQEKSPMESHTRSYTGIEKDCFSWEEGDKVLCWLRGMRGGGRFRNGGTKIFQFESEYWILERQSESLAELLQTDTEKRIWNESKQLAKESALVYVAQSWHQRTAPGKWSQLI